MGHTKWIGLAVVCLSLPGQVPDQVRQATIRGSGGSSGKCTIEVRVDVAAEVDVYGDSGRLRTLGGQPATWGRLECTGPLPRNMSDFKFQGIDGRGQVRLAQDPRNNNGMAVIRIEDSKSGSESYTFDIEWSGGSGSAPTGGFPTGGGFPNDDRNPRGFPGRRPGRGITAERAIDMCRAEVRTRAERDYNLRNIDVTAAAIDGGPGRTDWVTGTFVERAGGSRRGTSYRFNCSVDFNAGQVRNVEVLGADGHLIQPGTSGGQSGYDQNRLYRACQDAVVARTGRDGYQNVNFTSIAIDPNRSGSVSGTITAVRGPVTDQFDFACSMDFGNATVRNVQVNRR